MNIEETGAVLESILFAVGEPISINKLSALLETEVESLRLLLEKLTEEYERDLSRGIKIIRLEDKYQLCTKAEHSRYVKMALNNRRNIQLSPASLEVLSIIAYNQPVTRGYIEQIRGVDSSAVVLNLVEKELAEEKGRLDAPGRPLLYGTTPNFLRCFGISSLDDLPALPEMLTQNEDEQIVLNV